MATNVTFKYQHPFPIEKDDTQYYLLTKDYVSVSEFEGTPILKIEKEGLTATVYTQVSDVEQEVNGIMTYDRKVLKINQNTLRSIHSKLKFEE